MDTRKHGHTDTRTHTQHSIRHSCNQLNSAQNNFIYQLVRRQFSQYWWLRQNIGVLLVIMTSSVRFTEDRLCDWAYYHYYPTICCYPNVKQFVKSMIKLMRLTWIRTNNLRVEKQQNQHNQQLKQLNASNWNRASQTIVRPSRTRAEEKTEAVLQQAIAENDEIDSFLVEYKTAC